MRTTEKKTGSCIVCIRHGLSDAGTRFIRLCRDCAHSDEIRIYCAICKQRHRLTLEQAKALFVDTGSGVPIERVGIAMLYDKGCPACAEDAPLPRLFYIDKEATLNTVM